MIMLANFLDSIRLCVQHDCLVYAPRYAILYYNIEPAKKEVNDLSKLLKAYSSVDKQAKAFKSFSKPRRNAIL